MENSAVILNIADFEAVIYQSVRKAISEIENARTPTDERDQLLTRKEAAEYLKITLPTLRKHTIAGVVRCHEIGSRILYKRKELESALRSPRFRKEHQ